MRVEGSDGGWNAEVFADDGLQLKTEKEANCSILIAPFEKLQNETLGTRLSGPLILHMERRGLFTFFCVQINHCCYFSYNLSVHEFSTRFCYSIVFLFSYFRFPFYFIFSILFFD